jgi:hypothetical protein
MRSITVGEWRGTGEEEEKEKEKEKGKEDP